MIECGSRKGVDFWGLKFIKESVVIRYSELKPIKIRVCKNESNFKVYKKRSL